MSHGLRCVAAFAVCSFVVSAALWVTGSDDAVELLMTFGPMLALLVPLLSGRYVGESLLEVCRNRALGTPRARAAALRLPRTPEKCRHNGGRLIARALAERGPPAAAVVVCA